MSALLFASLLMSSNPTNASQISNNNDSTSSSSNSDLNINNGNTSSNSDDSTTNTFNIPNSSQTNNNNNNFSDTLYASHTTAYIKKHFYDNLSPTERSSKLWIASHESSYSYTSSNGDAYGRFQLKDYRLHGDYSPINQEKTADKYVKDRYGSWENAKKVWIEHKEQSGGNNGWYSMDN